MGVITKIIAFKKPNLIFADGNSFEERRNG